MLKRTRIRYWSESMLSHKIRNFFELPNPIVLSWEGWDEHERLCREKAPFIHWLTDKGFNKIQNIVNFPTDLWWNLHTATIWKFFRNFWLFRKVLWNYRSWDYNGLLNFMETSARDMSRCHKDHGHLMRSEETAQELKVWAALIKRVREDNYQDDKLEFVRKEGAMLGGEFVQVPNSLPNHKAKSFYKIVDSNRKNDLELIGKMFSRKVKSWWD